MKSTRTRVKVCGISQVEDALSAADAGADAIGLIFFEKSPRAVSIEQAREIIKQLPPFVSIVGLFVNPEPSLVRKVLSQVSLDRLQFHGSESADFCQLFGVPYIKALAVEPDMDIAAEIKKYPDAKGILLDTWHANLAGGTGTVFDWRIIQSLDRASLMLDRRLILAGGLTCENITRAISEVRPHAVDVSSGLEVEAGIKSSEKIRLFFEEVNRV